MTIDDQEFVKNLELVFEANKNLIIAQQQKQYMRNKFAYYGIKTPVRREIQKPFLITSYLPKKEVLPALIHILWNKPQREYQHFGQELVYKYLKEQKKEDIVLFEFMITNKSWWDTVDFIAVKLLGAYFKKFPELREVYTKKWLQSTNIWLKRSAVLFQLKYKKELDTLLLEKVIKSLLGSKEFFINKAIGWVLREYSRTNPKWVLDFVENTSLEPLSRREAIKLLK